MTHRARILKVLRGLPAIGRQRPTLPRTALEGLARTARDKAAAPQLIDYMVALGELEILGHARGAGYALPRRK